ncbi:MAG: conjugal transfer protein TraX [Oscillospiraceae bacterium]|jgi:hypothetical protein|nr:conjugal transfer protein TraX [Oscillospiraceae bacterium]
MNKDTTTLKLIAITLMIVDHVGAMFFPLPGGLWLRVVGRLAFPLFAYCVAVGVKHTRSIWGYGLRLVVLFAVSQTTYMLALNHGLWTLNIFATLLLGLIMCAGVRFRQYWLTAIFLVASLFSPADYGFRGALVILVMYLFQDNPLAFSAAFSLFCFAWGESAGVTLNIPWTDVAVRLNWGGTSQPVWRVFGNHVVKLQPLAILSLPLMLYPKKERARYPLPDKAMYLAYPLHLFVLYVVKTVVK